MKDISLHIGSLIERKIKEIGMTNSEFARRIKTSKQNVQDIFTRQSVDTKLLSRISDVLNYDFFEYFEW